MTTQKSKKKKRTPTPPSCNLSTRFNVSDYDITLESIDDVSFRVHKNYLEMNSNGFASQIAAVSTPDEVVSLPEQSTVLELLLQYIYPGPQPDLGAVEFTDLADVAEAAQKYEVWSAMEITKLHMRLAAPEHAFEVLVYASMHDFLDMANEAVKYCWRAPMTEAVERLHPNYLKGFAWHADLWRTAVEETCAFAEISHVAEDQSYDTKCNYWAWKVDSVQWALRTWDKLPTEQLELFQVDKSEEVHGGTLFPCELCRKAMDDWRAQYLDLWYDIRNISNVYPYP